MIHWGLICGKLERGCNAVWVGLFGLDGVAGEAEHGTFTAGSGQ